MSVEIYTLPDMYRKTNNLFLESYDFKRWFLVFSLILFIMFLTSCGGGGSSNSEGSKVAVYGAITDIDNFTVNGTAYNTKDAVLYLPNENISRVLENDHVIADEGLLKTGMVVSLKGVKYHDGTAIAEEILYTDNLEGVIESKGPSSMVVMGQTVVPELQAMAAFTTLMPGDIVEVSGMFDVQANIRATYLEKKPYRTGDYEIKGFIFSITSPTSLTLRTVFLSASQAFYTVNVSSTAGLNTGDLISVTTDSFPVIGLIAGKQINIIYELNISLDYKMEFEGYVYNLRLQTDSFNLVVDYEIPLIEMSTDTVIVGGSKADITEGRKVEVEAVFSDITYSPMLSFGRKATTVILK